MNNKKNLLQASLALLLSLTLAPSILAQETKEKPTETRETIETVAVIDFTDATKVAYVNGYAFGGYGVEGDTEGKTIAKDQFTVKQEICKDGKDGKGCAATLDTSNLKLPSDTNYDYFGFACGGAVDLDQAWTATDLAGYTFSFDAKVEGTSSLANSKAIISFVVPDDQLAKDEDSFDDVVCRQISGSEDEGGLFTITNEFKTFTFDMKDKMNITKGTVADIVKHKVKRVSFAIQAQGTVDDIGMDNDNRLIIDNLRIVKKK